MVTSPSQPFFPVRLLSAPRLVKPGPFRVKRSLKTWNPTMGLSMASKGLVGSLRIAFGSLPGIVPATYSRWSVPALPVTELKLTIAPLCGLPLWGLVAVGPGPQGERVADGQDAVVDDRLAAISVAARAAEDQLAGPFLREIVPRTGVAHQTGDVEAGVRVAADADIGVERDRTGPRIVAGDVQECAVIGDAGAVQDQPFVDWIPEILELQLGVGVDRGRSGGRCAGDDRTEAESVGIRGEQDAAARGDRERAGVGAVIVRELQYAGTDLDDRLQGGLRRIRVAAQMAGDDQVRAGVHRDRLLGRREWRDHLHVDRDRLIAEVRADVDGAGERHLGSVQRAIDDVARG